MKILMMIPAYRKLVEENASLRMHIADLQVASRRKTEMLSAAYDVAYERRLTLREIANAGRDSTNGTARKMARMADKHLGAMPLIDVVASVKRRDGTVGVGQPGEVAIGRGVSAAGGAGGVSK